MATLTVKGALPGKAQAEPVECGDTGAVIANRGPNTVYYRDEEPVSASVNDGSLASGSATTLYGNQFFVVDEGASASRADSATLVVTPVPAAGGSASTVVLSGARPSIYADDHAWINGAAATLAASGGGRVELGASTFIGGGVVLDTNVWLSGQGDATILQLADGANAHTVQSKNFATLTGTDTTATPHNLGLLNLVVDGNKANQTSTVHGVALYAYGFTLRGIKVRNAHDYGVWSEWATSSASPGADSMEASITEFKIHGCGAPGMLLRGPHDTHVLNGIIYDNCQTYVAGVGALDISGNLGANGSIVDMVHVWGNNHSDYACRITTSGIALGPGFQAENAAVAQVYINNSSNRVNGKLFSGGVTQTTVKGLVIAGSASNISGTIKVENCGGGALDISASNGNLNLDVFASYSSTPAPATGIIGSLHTTDRVSYHQLDANGVPTSDSGLSVASLKVRGFGRGPGVSVPQPATTEFLVSLTSSTGTDNTNWTLGRVFWVPVEVAVSTSISGVGLNLAGSASGGSTPLVRLGVYADDGTGTKPSGSPLANTEGTFDPTTTTGDKVVSFAGGNQTMQPGRYWLAAMLTSAGGTALGTLPTLTTAPGLLNQTGVATLANASRRNWAQDTTSTATALPAASAAMFRTGVVPFIGLKLA